MSNHTGGWTVVVALVLTLSSLILAHTSITPNELRPIFAWAALFGALGMLIGMLEMGGPR